MRQATMPLMPPSPCRHPGCGVLTTAGRCPAHKRAQQKAHDARRGSSAARLYGAEWQRARKEFLAARPWCELQCKAEGKRTPASVVDHIEPHRGDTAKFWNRHNWQPACKPCHDRVKQKQERAKPSPQV